MRKSVKRFSARIPLYFVEIDHVYDFGFSNQKHVI
ncbi:hypothetical protein ILFOPFJJ_04645 [Ensifer psoraleae]|nr:hypothetical protein [Sinorhizobium psoraleae]